MLCHYPSTLPWSGFGSGTTINPHLGTGRAFGVGADLKEWHDTNDPKRHAQSHDASSQPKQLHNRTDLHLPRSGFGGLSNRSGKKPVIAAVNGICFGGGIEMVINCDMVIAAASAKIRPARGHSWRRCPSRLAATAGEKRGTPARYRDAENPTRRKE